MRIICAPDSFKGSLSAVEAAHAMAHGVQQRYPEATIDRCPISDGGEGFIQVIALANEHVMVQAACSDPLNRPVMASCCVIDAELDGGTAIIEMAIASGLDRLKQEERDATLTSTYGTGQTHPAGA